MRAALPLLALALLLPTSANAGNVQCEYNESHDYFIGGVSYIHQTRHRCDFESGGVQYTQRLERYDVHRYDPYSTTGTSHAGALVLEALEARYSDGSRTLATELRFERDGTRQTLHYDQHDDPQGRATCTAAIDLERTPIGTLHARTPPLPACLPRGLLLP